jgi:PEP-CTERM motif
VSHGESIGHNALGPRTATRGTVTALVLALMLCSAATARAGQITLSGSTDANLFDPTGTGAFTQINADPPANFGLEAVNFASTPGVDFEKRSVVEFNNSVLPSNITIEAVTLNFQIISTANNQHDVGVYAYAGSGSIGLADATTSATQAGTYNDSALGIMSISLNASTFQALLAQSSFFALRLQGLEQSVNTTIGSDEQAPGFAPPTLTISFASVPEPSSLVLAATSAGTLAGLAAFRRRRPRMRSPE